MRTPTRNLRKIQARTSVLTNFKGWSTWQTKRNEGSLFKESSGVEREREKGAVPAGDGDGMVRTPEEEEKRKRRRLTKPSQIPSSNSRIAKSLITHSAYLSFIVGFLSRMRLYLQVWIHRRAVSCPYELSYDSYVTLEESDSHIKPRFTSTMCMLPSPKQLQTSCEPH